jgi:LuxR family maltose regulon positive regulatory protein
MRRRSATSTGLPGWWSAGRNRCNQSGRVATTEGWLGWLERHGALERNAAIAILGALVAAVQGRPAESDRWADAAEEAPYAGVLPDGSASIDSWLALLRALRCRRGVARMRTDAEHAMGLLGRASQFRPTAMLLLAVSWWLSGESSDADDLLADAAEEGVALGAPEPAMVALGVRAVIAIARESWSDAQELADGAALLMRDARMDEYPTSAFVATVAARVALHAGRATSAQGLLATGQRLRPRLTWAVPWLAAQTRLELARAYLTLADVGGARTMLRELDPILGRQPDLGKLPSEVEELRSGLKTLRVEVPGASTLTTAELRVLPLLATHLSFPEIAERMYLSRHTVKSHATAVYRKLNVTSRNAAIERARQLGLL